jgi:UDP-4-amino-4,6-dideoxy-N-acetyl-beta-L-altrosamine transaminase
MSDAPVIPYGHHHIDDDDIEAVVRVLRGDWLTQGPAVGEFESALCRRLGAPEAAAVNSGTAALHVGMLALGIGPGDLVVVPPITFVASANAALYCGADVAFVDVEPDTGLLSADALEAFLAGYRGPHRPRAVVAVHYAGLPCDLGRIGEICRRYGVELIEDACHAPGATWTDAAGVVRTVGDASTSAFAALSFHPVKHVATGEGGAVMTTRPELAERARMFRNHGITRDPMRLRQREGPWWYEMQLLGFNYRIPDILAALGTSQLGKFDRWLRRRRDIAARYRRAFADLPGIALQAERPGRSHAYHLFPILVDRRAEVLADLAARGIGAQVHYIPVHWQPVYVSRYGPQHFPQAEAWYARELSIPMFPSLTDAQVTRVSDGVAAVLGTMAALPAGA